MDEGGGVGKGVGGDKRVWHLYLIVNAFVWHI